MTQVPVIKITETHWLAAIKNMESGRNTYMDACNKAIEIALAEQATQDQFITADEARALGAGNAEYLDLDDEWCVCTAACQYYTQRDSFTFKYRAIRKEVPAEPGKFKRENRYIVLKNKDVAQLNLHQRLALKDVQDTIDSIRSLRGKPTLKCVVVESDDPAYEVAWKLIEQGVRPEPAELNKELLNKLLPWKLKIMPDDDGGTKWVKCVIRTNVSPREILYSVEVNYAGDPEFVKASSMEGAANMCMQDLVDKLDAMRQPTCQVRNLDTGELKTMTRGAAQKLQAETKDVCDWRDPEGHSPVLKDGFGFSTAGIYTYKRKANLVKVDGEFITELGAIAEAENKRLTHDVWYKFNDLKEFEKTTICFNPYSNQNFEYQLRLKQKKQVSWQDMPLGVMTDRGELRKVISTRHAEGARMQVETNQNASTPDVTEFYSEKDLTLAPADQQPWLNWRGGDCPVPNGVLVEVTLRNGVTLRSGEAMFGWGHDEPVILDTSREIIEYRVIGIADGWELV